MASILVGVGSTRGWRSTRLGAVAGFAVLAAIVIGMGAALETIPIRWLRLIVGALLLIFGLQWLKKAVVRLARPWTKKTGQGTDDVRPAAAEQIDWYAFVVAFKGVLLEGLEIAFVVVTFGAEARQVGLASAGAIAALVVVGAIAFLVRAWVARIPREWLRFGVGILLTTFGTFWSAEGTGVRWPGGEAALLVLLGIVAVFTLFLLAILRQAEARRLQTT